MRALGAPWAASFVAAESPVARGSLKVVGSPLCRSPCCNQSGDHDSDREYVMPDIHYTWLFFLEKAVFRRY